MPVDAGTNLTTMTIPEALAMSLLGFAIVFFVLIVLMAVINILRGLVQAMDASKEAAKAASASAAAPAAKAPAAPAAPNMVPAKGSLGEMNLFDVDDRTAALVMAIVADQIGAPLNELRFRSIREKK